MNKMGLRIGVLAAALALSGCYAATDSESYREEEVGTVTFTNESPVAAYLDGCNAFDQQEFEGGSWVSRGGENACVWEGNAQRVEPRSEVELAFRARSPGTWRLGFDVGAFCDERKPLGEKSCAAVLDVYSNEFTVGDACELGHFAACEPDSVCVRTKGDCCGCEMGGREAAVNQAHEQAWLDQAHCSPDFGACLAVYVCSQRIPACVDGCCQLVSP